jgi:antitoxin CcdA
MTEHSKATDLALSTKFQKQALRQENETVWKAENAEAFAYSNEYVERNGLPLAKYRQF